MNPEALQKYRQRMEALIEQHGWMVQAVFPTQDDPDHVSFQYTIGLHDQGLPELLAFGLPGESGMTLLNDVANHLLVCKATGQAFVGRVEHARWPMPFYVLRAETETANEYATGAWNRSQGQASFLQVVWPDRQGRFPWHPAFEKEFVEMQPLVGQPE